jgi:cell division protein FtsB
MRNSPLILKIVVAVLVCLLISLQVRLWMTEDGFSEMSRLRSQVEFQRNENSALADRNRRLEAEVEDLKKGFGAVEERARSDLGLIVPDESFYVFADPESAAKESAD